MAISASVLTHEQQQFRDAGFDDFIPKPFLVEKICECLTALLDVTFAPVHPPAHPQVEPKEIKAPQLPQAILLQLEQAAADHNLTKLSACIDEIELLGEAERLFAQRLRDYARDFEFEKLSEIIGKSSTNDHLIPICN